MTRMNGRVATHGGRRSWSQALLFLMLLASPCAAGQAVAQPAAAPPTNAPSVKASLDAMSALVRRVPNDPVEVSFAAFRVRSALDSLQRLAANWPAESPADYRQSLHRSVRTLEQAMTVTMPARLQAVLEALADDLEVKLEHCVQSGGKLGASVSVTVRTVQGDLESRNWQVFYVPKVFEALGGTDADRFPRLSSPTVETLVPGRYVVWARDPEGARTSERVVVKVGQGRKELQLDLIVPATAPR